MDGYGLRSIIVNCNLNLKYNMALTSTDMPTDLYFVSITFTMHLA